MSLTLEVYDAVLIVIATTQPTTQNNLKQLLLGWSYNRQENHTTHQTTTPGIITIRAVLDNLGS
jgi:hypothetical protein